MRFKNGWVYRMPVIIQRCLKKSPDCHQKNTESRKEMKDKVKKLLLLMWILLICCMLSGCEKEKKKVTITVIHSWGGTEADQDAMRHIYEQFQN